MNKAKVVKGKQPSPDPGPSKRETKKKGKEAEKKKEVKVASKENKSVRVKRTPQAAAPPNSDVNDDEEDKLDDNQNLIQLTYTPTAIGISVKRKAKAKAGAKPEEKHHEESVTGKDKGKKPVPAVAASCKPKKSMDNYIAMSKAIEAKTVEEMVNEYRVNHKPSCEELNRDTRYVLTFNVPPDSDFYDASRIDMPGIDCKFIAASAPTNDSLSMETFWRLVYDANVANVFFVEPAGKDFTALASFIPLEPNSSKDYGKMFVNNKKVERNPKEYQAVLEVLPEGCSNSIIVRFIQCRQWPEYIARKYRRIALHLVRTLKNEKSISLIVCKDGRSHTGQFILLHSIITELCHPSGPEYKLKMVESLAALRNSRWGSIQTEQQYLLMYMLSLDFLACKSKNFEPQARTLEKTMLEYIKKRKTDEKKDKKAEAATQFGKGTPEKDGPAVRSLYL